MVRQRAGGLGSTRESDQGRVWMFISSKLLSRTAAGMAARGALGVAEPVTPSGAQKSVKSGLILPMTGGQASTGKQIDNAIKLYMQQHGDTVDGTQSEVILKDDAH